MEDPFKIEIIETSDVSLSPLGDTMRNVRLTKRLVNVNEEIEPVTCNSDRTVLELDAPAIKRWKRLPPSGEPPIPGEDDL